VLGGHLQIFPMTYAYLFLRLGEGGAGAPTAPPGYACAGVQVHSWTSSGVPVCKSTTDNTSRSHLLSANTRLLSVHGHGQPTATGASPSVDQPRGTVYLWHCGEVMLWKRPPEDNFCLTVLVTSHRLVVDS